MGLFGFGGQKPEKRCPHGFSSCKEYVVRVYGVGRDTLITWTEGGLEDHLALKVDGIELRIKALSNRPCDDGVHNALEAEKSTCLLLLEGVLKTSLDEPGEYHYLNLDLADGKQDLMLMGLMRKQRLYSRKRNDG